MWFVCNPRTSEEVPDGDGRRVGSAPPSDHVRRGGARVGRGVAGSGVAAGSGPVPSVAARRGDASSERRAGGVGGGGLHRLALCGRGDRGRRVRTRISAEPADTQAARGRKRRAKTDRSDARLLRDLLAADELPESWIPPEPVLEWRERVRLYVSLVHQRTVWCQRIHAELYHHGVAVPGGSDPHRRRPARCSPTTPWSCRRRHGSGSRPGIG